MVTGVVPSPPPVLAFNFHRAYRVQQPHCSSIIHRVLLLITHALALSASQFVHKNKPKTIYEYALGGTPTHETDQYQARARETDLYQARGQPDTPPERSAGYIKILSIKSTPPRVCFSSVFLYKRRATSS